MKKLILVFALAVAFGITATNAATTGKEDKKNETKKEVTTTTTKTTGCCSGKTATAEKSARTGCNETQKKSCAASGAACGGEAKKVEKK